MKEDGKKKMSKTIDVKDTNRKQETGANCGDTNSPLTKISFCS